MNSKSIGMSVSNITLSKVKFCMGNPVLTYAVRYPEFTSSCFSQCAKKINQYYRQRAENLVCRIHQCMIPAAIKDYRTNTDENRPALPYELISEYTVTQNERCLLSLYTDCYQMTGGAHGNTIRSSETWDLKTGCKICLPELCACQGSKIYTAIKTEIKKQIAAQAENYFENYEELVEQTFCGSQFYIENGKAVVYFQQYDIAPYVT